MSGDADKAWAEMVGGGPGAQRPSQTPAPAPSSGSAPPQASPKAPVPPLATAAKWGAVALLGLVAVIAVLWVILSNRTRPAIIDAPKAQATPARVDAPAQPAPSASSGSLLDLNSATAAQLEHLPGIGPAIAQRIIDDRTKHGRYTSVDDLDRVQGIGKKTIDKLRPYVMAK